MSEFELDSPSQCIINLTSCLAPAHVPDLLLHLEHSPISQGHHERAELLQSSVGVQMDLRNNSSVRGALYHIGVRLRATTPDI